MDLDKCISELVGTFNKDRIQSVIIKYFQQNPYPTDDNVHQLSDVLEIPHSELEEHIYRLLTDFVQGVGKHKQVPDTKFNQKELEMGIEIEMEHTDNKSIAKEIAKDHLAECPDYYTRLVAMEKECDNRKV